MSYITNQTSQYELSLLQGMNFEEPSFFYSSSTHSDIIEEVQHEVNLNTALHSLIGHLGIIGYANSSGKAAGSFKLCLWPDHFQVSLFNNPCDIVEAFGDSPLVFPCSINSLPPSSLNPKGLILSGPWSDSTHL